MNKTKVALGTLLLALAVGDALLAPITPAATPTDAKTSVATSASASVGAAAPDFTLSDTHGKSHSLSQYKGKLVVLEWNNPDCPFVKKHYDSHNMQALQEKYTGKGVVWLAINSSAKGANGSHSSKEINDIQGSKHSHESAYLLDESGKVGHLYGATATPHMFVIDTTGKLIYAGAIDDKNTADAADAKTAHNYVSAALDAALAGKPVAVSSTKAYGCRVHYQ